MVKPREGFLRFLLQYSTAQFLLLFFWLKQVTKMVIFLFYFNVEINLSNNMALQVTWQWVGCGNFSPEGTENRYTHTHTLILGRTDIFLITESILRCCTF